MSAFNLVDPQGWEYDLQSVYSAYIGHFQLHNIPWYDRSWGHLFESFEEFLVFSWPVITVTDARTGRAHIVTRMTSIGAFLKMIKTRFGETLPTVDNILKVEPFETTTRHLRTISDWATFKKLHSTLPAAMLSAFRARVKGGDIVAIRQLWERKDKTFLAVDFKWSERNSASCLEWGYAAVRCGHLVALDHWPPQPDTNYRKGHYIVSEYADKVVNKHAPTFPWLYAFGESQLVVKNKLPQIIQAVVSSLIGPDSETTSNNVVIVGHGISGELSRWEDMKIKLPHNVLVIDTLLYEKNLFATGDRGSMLDSKGKARVPGSSLSLEGLLRSFNIDIPCQLHNSGNDAFMSLFALQKLLESQTPQPTVRPRKSSALPKNGNPIPRNTMLGAPMAFSGYAMVSPMVPAGSANPTLLSSELIPRPPSGHLDGDTSPIRRARSPRSNARDLKRMSAFGRSKHVHTDREVLNSSMQALNLK